MTDSAYANAPFDHEKADIILRSSDNVDFRVFKLFLSLASPFFETLFDIPQPTDASGDGQEVKDGLAVIPVVETSKTLDALLRFCYPCTLAEDPELEVLRDVADLLEAAKKYSLDAIEKKVRQAITTPKILEAEPLRCFAVACQGRLQEETVLSAKYTLTQPLVPTWFQEIELITTTEFLTLLTYHKRCADAVYALRVDPSWIESHYGGYSAAGLLIGQNNHYGSCGCQRSSTYTFGYQRVQWWEKFMDEVFMELRDKPCRGTVQTIAEKTVQTVKAQNCSVCAPAVAEGMRNFSDLLVSKVEEAVSQIELGLNF